MDAMQRLAEFTDQAWKQVQSEQAEAMKAIYGGAAYMIRYDPEAGRFIYSPVDPLTPTPE